MRGLLADHNCAGHLRKLESIFKSKIWKGLWRSLNLSVESFASVGMPFKALDREVWQFCQDQQLVLITKNRNDDGPDSLEATIRTMNELTCLPVITIPNADLVLRNKIYAKRVAESLLDYLVRMDDLLGAGRLYVP